VEGLHSGEGIVHQHVKTAGFGCCYSAKQMSKWFVYYNSEIFKFFSISIIQIKNPLLSLANNS
jgi:hypothetical protein